MTLNISIAAHSRFFGKAMRRIRPSFNKLADTVHNLNLANPGFSSFLIAITDDPTKNGVEVIFTDSDTRQVMIGMGEYISTESDESILNRSLAFISEALRIIDVDNDEDFHTIFTVIQDQQSNKIS